MRERERVRERQRERERQRVYDTKRRDGLIELKEKQGRHGGGMRLSRKKAKRTRNEK